MQDLRGGRIGRPVRPNIVRSSMPNAVGSTVAVATPDLVRYATNHEGVRHRIMLDPAEAMTEADWRITCEQSLSGIIINQTATGFDDYLSNIFATIMFATSCETRRNGVISLEGAHGDSATDRFYNHPHSVTDRFHDLAGGRDLVNAINTLIMAMRHIILMFSPSKGCLGGTSRGAMLEREIVEEIFGTNAEAIRRLRRLACNRVKMHDREHLTLLRDNTDWGRTAPQVLRSILIERRPPQFPPHLKKMMTELLRSSQYDTEDFIKRRKRGDIPEGLILDEWAESASYHCINEDLILEWGSTRGLVTASHFLACNGFHQIAACYLRPDGPIASATVARV